MARKTIPDYADEIKDLHHKLQHRREIMTPEEIKSIEKKLSYRVAKWSAMLEVVIQVANNEGIPWTSEMIGYPTEPMPLKAATGFHQTGDYQGVVRSFDGDRYIDLLIERKATEDLYGTLIDEGNRTRFYREIERFKNDRRFNQMIIMVEGTLSDFLLYQPEFKGGKFDYKRRYDTKKNGSINEKKLTVLSDLFVMGVPVLFCGDPALAAQMCGRLIRESIRKRYWKILELAEED